MIIRMETRTQIFGQLSTLDFTSLGLFWDYGGVWNVGEILNERFFQNFRSFSGCFEFKTDFENVWTKLTISENWKRAR